MKIKEVTNYLEEIAPLQFQESYFQSFLKKYVLKVVKIIQKCIWQNQIVF